MQREATSDLDSPFAPQEGLYQHYSTAEDQARTNFHYERPVEFFNTITGDPWNVYSCNLWPDENTTLRESQELKLDMIAGVAELAPGRRLLDVGAGWGGPLGYLCREYELQGVGLTLSPAQHVFATERLERLGVDARMVMSHWADYDDDEPFDALYTDEVIVHFTDLGAFFNKIYSLLRPGGMMVNKELHYRHGRYAEFLSRGQKFINAIYAGTGNYRTLGEELRLVEYAGFDLVAVHHIDKRHYERTLDSWLANMHAGRARLIELVGEAYYRAFRVYLKLARRSISQDLMTIDVVVSRKPFNA